MRTVLDSLLGDGLTRGTARRGIDRFDRRGQVCGRTRRVGRQGRQRERLERLRGVRGRRAEFGNHSLYIYVCLRSLP